MKKQLFSLKRILTMVLALALCTHAGAAFAEEPEIPEYGTIVFQTNPVTITDEYGVEHQEYDPRVDTHSNSSNDLGIRIYYLFKAVPTFDESGNLNGIAYYCKDSHKTIEGFTDYFNVGSDNSITVKDSAVGEVDEDGNRFLSPEAIEWIKAHYSDLSRAYNIADDGIHLDSWATDGRLSVSRWNDTFTDGTPQPWADVEKDENEKFTGKITFRYLPFGYYYIDSNVGSVAVINSTDPVATITDKNEHSKLEKTITKITNADNVVTNPDTDGVSPDIQPGHTDALSPSGNNKPAHVATVGIGDTVEYTVHVTMGKGAGYESFKIEDTMSSELTLKEDSIQILAGEEKDLVDPENYTLAISSPYVNPGIGYYRYMTRITISFKQSYLDTLEYPVDLYLVYECVVKPEAIVAWNTYYPYNARSYPAFNYNTAVLTYGRTGRVEDTDRFYITELKIYKYEGDGTSVSSGSKPLNGVKFVLKNSEGQFLKKEGKVLHWVNDQEEATPLVTGGSDSSATEQTTTGPVNYSAIVSSGYETYPRLGPDGKSGTEDDYTEIISYESGKFIVYKVYVGEDKEAGTWDDIVTKNLLWPDSGTPDFFIYTSGEDKEWNTDDDMTVLRSAEEGMITIDGLTNGTYTLIETEGLPGYSQAPDMEITINNQNNTFEELKYQVNVVNKMGSVLPSTGGAGTTIFYVIGTIMLIGSGVILNEKKRKRAA